MLLSFSFSTVHPDATTGYSKVVPSNSVALKYGFVKVEGVFAKDRSSNVLEPPANSSLVAYSTWMLSTTAQPFAEVEESPSQSWKLTEVSYKE